MRGFGHGLQTVILIGLSIIVGINGILLVKRFVLKEELPSVMGWSVVAVLSGSMEPAFSTGDMLLIKKQPVYEVGDVLTFQEQGAYITHRLIEKNRGKYITKGDANDAPDERTVRYSSVCGKVRVIIPKLGSVVMFCKSELGIFVLIVVLLLLVEVPNGRFFQGKKQ